VSIMSSPGDLLVQPRYQDELADKIPNAEIKRYFAGAHVHIAFRCIITNSKTCLRSAQHINRQAWPAMPHLHKEHRRVA